MNKENVNQKFAIYITTAGQSGGIFAPKMTSYLHFLSQPTKESKFNQTPSFNPLLKNQYQYFNIPNNEDLIQAK